MAFQQLKVNLNFWYSGILDRRSMLALTTTGVEIFSPQGKHLGIMRMSCNDQDCQSLALSGPEKAPYLSPVWRSLEN